MSRYARGDLCRIFNMYEGNRHLVKAVGDYHWYTLSVTRTKALFKQHGFTVRVIHVTTFLASTFGCEVTHNRGAYTFLIG